MTLDRMLAYTAALEAHNDRGWFHENHAQYEQAQGDFLELLDCMKLAVAQVAPELGDSIMFTSPKAFMYRIPRDMRYSRGKLPYNPAFRAYFSPDKKKFLPISYYLHISHRGCSLTGGAYPWEPEKLDRLRRHILENGEEFERAVSECGLEIQGKVLKRVPRGFPADHPMSEWMKYKYFLAERQFFDRELRDFESMTAAARDIMSEIEPLRAFLSAAFTGCAEPEFDFDFETEL